MLRVQTQEEATMHEPTVSAAGLRMVRLLVGNPPQTVSDLIEATGVTRTAVTEQLNELVAAGFVRRTTERLPGRGRPRHLYSATNASLRFLFANNQHLVVPAIWRAVHAIGGDKLTRRVLRRVSHALADHYKRQITAKDPKHRLEEFVELLRDEGGLLEAVEEDGQLVLRKRSCPFISMLDDKHTVCCVDLETMIAVVGCPVERTACRLEGAPCCTFELATAPE